jgi:hypothetical protein
MRSYLIVANRTLGSPGLDEAIRERLAAGEAAFHVVVPATPVGRGLTWDESETREAAEQRLASLIDRIRELGGVGDGEIGVSDPVDAARDAMRDREIEEVILSTLPAGISRWLGQDVPSRLRGAVSVPVIVVTAPRETAATGPT